MVSGSAIYEATSTPILSWTDTTSGWVRTKLDRVGRPVETTDFDGADLPFPFNNGGGRTTGSSGSVLILYSANEETVTDKAGKVIKTVRDGLGRVTSVVQDGNTTNYGYDALGNLVRVDQNGGGFSQVRIFVYDHHSRLLQAWQPETSPMSPADPGNPGVPTNRPTIYSYNDDGNLWTRTDGRGVITTHTYDVHGKLKATSYSDGTPSVTLNYDFGGRLSSADAANVSTTTFYYDSLGRFQRSGQTTFGVPYNFGTSAGDSGYGWNLADALVRSKLPSGRVIDYAVSAANRQQSLTSNSQVYSQVSSFAPSGVPRFSTYGNGATESLVLNSLGQLTGLTIQRSGATLLSLTNEYEPSANNGNLKSQTIAPVNMKQSYLYDARNRLGSASEQPTGGGAVTWSQSFGFDDFGNNWVSAQEGALPGGGPRPNQAAWYQMAGTSGTVVNNRIAGEQYDGAGNQTSLGALTAEYDGAGRMKLIRSGSRTVASFAYDAFGQRVWAVRDGLSTVMVYDALGRLSAEYEAGVAGPLQPQYLTMDQLGSVRIATDGAGNVVRRADFLPFGEEIPAGLGGRTLAGYGQGGPRQRFTGQERETESGVDYFKARYFNGAQGRFTSADGPMVDQSAGDPGSWNLFAYGRNNPLRWVDPSGRCSQVAPGNYVDSDTEGSLIFKGLCRSGTIGSSGKPSMDVQADRESIVSNNDFFLYWITSQLPQSIYYGADDPATKEIAGGSTVRRAIRE